ncbi:hypothetical protein B0T20DRAFT_395536 [Sordaria brevicollis]|uniref:Uncharacterized protein n=1 Tax=Sordaria brevicollis TaxID=83679 RepID=A0AAE0U988_SORBR|nr:hypothetical protein B0T20DRAFT_395536 [Sordaria brevicollis]
MDIQGAQSKDPQSKDPQSKDTHSHGPGAPSFSAHLQAATALHEVLFDHWIPHVFIGSFAFNLLGTTRPTTNIKVIIEDSIYSPTMSSRSGRTAQSTSTTSYTGQKFLEPIHRIRQLLVTMDERFSLIGSETMPKHIFTATIQVSEGEDGAETETKVVVPVQTLRAGTLGLPRHLDQTLEVRGVPVLAPRYLLLTAIKQCANRLESDRPELMEELKADEKDIKWLLKRLAEVKEEVDFEGYLYGGTDPDPRDGKEAYADCMKAREDLCEKVGQLVRFWRQKGGEKEQKMVKNLRKALRDDDDWFEVIRKAGRLRRDGKFA